MRTPSSRSEYRTSSHSRHLYPRSTVSMRGCLLALLVLASMRLTAAEMKIELPAETNSFKFAPGVQLANGQCLSCHSVEYVVTQPPLSRTYWAGAVKKMKEKFGAPIPEDQMEPLVSYLVENYGATANGTPAATLTKETGLAPAATEPLNPETMAGRYGCLGCHNPNVKVIAPPFREIAARLRTDPNPLERVRRQIHNGGAPKAGAVIMPPFPMISDVEAKALGEWILSQAGK